MFVHQAMHEQSVPTWHEQTCQQHYSSLASSTKQVVRFYVCIEKPVWYDFEE